jgi:hypothetical protein
MPQLVEYIDEYYQDSLSEGPSNSNDMCLLSQNYNDFNLLESLSSYLENIILQEEDHVDQGLLLSRELHVLVRL